MRVRLSPSYFRAEGEEEEEKEVMVVWLVGNCKKDDELLITGAFFDLGKGREGD